MEGMVGKGCIADSSAFSFLKWLLWTRLGHTESSVFVWVSDLWAGTQTLENTSLAGLEVDQLTKTCALLSCWVFQVASVHYATTPTTDLIPGCGILNCICMCVFVCVHIYAYIHIHIGAYTHTYICTQHLIHGGHEFFGVYAPLKLIVSFISNLRRSRSGESKNCMSWAAHMPSSVSQYLGFMSSSSPWLQLLANTEAAVVVQVSGFLPCSWVAWIWVPSSYLWLGSASGHFSHFKVNQPVGHHLSICVLCVRTGLLKIVNTGRGNPVVDCFSKFTSPKITWICYMKYF